MSCPSVLVDWQRRHLDSLRKESFRRSATRDVTVLAYYFRAEKECYDNFWQTEFAFLKTFQTQGLLPSVLVVNRKSEMVLEFCNRYSIEIQVAENLVPGQIETLALDMVENIHARFSTDYVLTIQDDGFPMRSGLEEFVGKYDYIGAPWVRHSTYYDLYPAKYMVGNGGFSLRSRALCEIASKTYRKWFRHLPYWWFVAGDDTFYCKTLRFWFRNAVRGIKWPTPSEAARFSIDTNDRLLPSEPPLGFHSEGFLRYIRYLDGEKGKPGK